MIARRNFFLRLLGVAFAAAPFPAVLRAETKLKHKAPGAPSPASSPDPAAAPVVEKNAVARVRLWKASDSSDSSLQIRFLPFGKADSAAFSPLKIEADNYQFSDYVEVPAGPTVAEIAVANRPTVRLPLQLAEGGQSTLLVRHQGANLSAEWMDDAPAPSEKGCEFGVYNLLPASGEIQIELGSILTVHLSSIHSSIHLTGIKKASYPVIANGTDGSGKSFHWSTDADFRQCHKATLLVFPDAYGRIRPRINAV